MKTQKKKKIATDIRKYKRMNGETDRQRERLTGRQIDRQTKRETDRQTDKERERQTDT